MRTAMLGPRGRPCPPGLTPERKPGGRRRRGRLGEALDHVRRRGITRRGAHLLLPQVEEAARQGFDVGRIAHLTLRLGGDFPPGLQGLQPGAIAGTMPS